MWLTRMKDWCDLHLVEHVPSRRAGLIMPTEVERISVSSSHTHKKNEKRKTEGEERKEKKIKHPMIAAGSVQM